MKVYYLESYHIMTYLKDRVTDWSTVHRIQPIFMKCNATLR